MNTTPISGMTALVTGGAKRLGRAIATALADAGVNVVVHCRHAGDARELCEDLEKRGVNAWEIDADLEDPRQTEALIANAVSAAGQIDILVNNASIFHPGTAATTTFADVTQHLQINAWAPFVITREFANQKQRGKVVNLLDSRIEWHDSGHLAYSMSKRSLADLTRFMAIEFAPNITVNAIAPGLVLAPAGRDESYLENLAKNIPLKRHGTPADISQAALYLLSSDFLTGQIIFADGGQSLNSH